MPTVEFVAAQPEHLPIIAERMREIDRRECAAFGHDPLEGLRTSCAQSIWSLTALSDGRPEALFGVAAVSLVEGRGTPFFLGTDVVYKNARPLLERGPAVIAYMAQFFDSLENIVSVENRAAIRLLKRWGFSVGDDVRAHGGVDFVPFRMTCHV